MARNRTHKLMEDFARQSRDRHFDIFIQEKTIENFN